MQCLHRLQALLLNVLGNVVVVDFCGNGLGTRRIHEREDFIILHLFQQFQSLLEFTVRFTRETDDDIRAQRDFRAALSQFAGCALNIPQLHSLGACVSKPHPNLIAPADVNVRIDGRKLANASVSSGERSCG